jgi:hypothetical protein
MHNSSNIRQRYTGGIRPAMAVLICLTGCSSSGASEEEQRKTVALAASTAVAAIDAWMAEAVPSGYARLTIEAMDQAVSQIRAPEGSPVRRASDALVRAEAAIDAGDRPVLVQAANELKAIASDAGRAKP